MLKKLIKSTIVITILVVSNLLHGQTQFTPISVQQSKVDFINIIQDNNNLNIFNYEYLYNGGGVAIGDINNDNLPDIYFSGNMVANKLFLNKGNFTFQDISNSSGTEAFEGYKTGVSMVDINNDGFLDIYVCRSASSNESQRTNLLYINNKNNTFTEQAKQYNLNDAGYSTQSYFADIDKDGDVDMFLLNHPKVFGSDAVVNLKMNSNAKLEAVKDTARQYVSFRYYQNTNGKFYDKTIKAGLGTYAFGLSAVIDDFNTDGYPDIYTSNDYREHDYLFINNKNGTFTENAKDYFKHFTSHSMGSDYADINNDGFLDLFVLDMLPPELPRQKVLKGADNFDLVNKKNEHGFGYQFVKNVLQLNNGNNTYSDISYMAGVAYTDWSWAPLIADFDNDGFKDMYVSKGYLRDITDMDFQKFGADSMKKLIRKTNEPEQVLKLLDAIPTHKVSNFYFRNNKNLTFSNNTIVSGLDVPTYSNGAAYADLDNDGDLDIVVNNAYDYASIFKNNTIENKQGNFINIKLNGSQNNLNAIGAKIELKTPDGVKQVLHVNPYKGFLSSNQAINHFGIGANVEADIIITWPNNLVQEVNKIAANKQFEADIKNAQDSKSISINNKTIFKNITKNIKLKYQHTEQNYIDYKQEPLLPHMLSKQGPCVAVADVNADKLQDFFVGGSANVAAQIFVQTTQGTFEQRTFECWKTDSKFEDTGCEFFDADTDGDLDILVVSGSNELGTDITQYPVRLYINDGSGNYTKSKNFGKFYTSGNAIAIADFDNDKDPDIFIGGRLVPNHYGLMPQSILLKNTNGNFEDVTTTIPALQKIGMVTDAVWCDINKDKNLDLVIVGEWMPITIFLNNNGSLNGQAITIPNSDGWWNCINASDIDADGDVDLIGGNLGLNSKFRGNTQYPVTMLVSDFDENGSTDCVISIFQEFGKNISYPYVLRDRLLDQMPFLRKKYLRYRDYASETVEQIFTKPQLAKANKLTASTMFSGLFINEGDLKFKLKPFGPKVQVSPINAIIVDNFNGDTNLDILLAGNNFNSEVESGRDDAGVGVLLNNLTGNNFKSSGYTDSGFFADGDVKSMKSIIIKNKNCLIVGNNSSSLQFWQIGE